MEKEGLNKLLLTLVILLYVVSAQATVKLSSIFGDHMVLQQQSNVAVWGWAKPSSTLKIITSWNKKSYSITTNASGKWVAKLQTPSAGGPYEISFNDGELLVLKDVLIGEVWFCGGQANMEMPMKGFKSQPILGSNEAILKSTNPNLRMYIVPRSSIIEVQENSKPSVWKSANPESVSNFSATAYYFGHLVQEMLNVPVGLVNVSYSGSFLEAWMSKEELGAFPEVKIPSKGDTIKEVSRTATTLYNGMLHPVIGYGMRGMLFYQGESNYERPDRYEELFPAFVSNLRKAWNIGDFPFYYAQIAPFKYSYPNTDLKNEKLNSAYLRDAQRKSLQKITNSGMAVLMDLGELNNIHPARKKEGGERLAYLALAQTYRIKGFGYASPTYESISIDKDKVTVKFQQVTNGLTSFGKTLSLFEIAGADRKFYPAKASINGSSVAVTAEEVKDPVAVRYAFKNFLVGDLFGNDGLPVSSFRTDNW